MACEHQLIPFILESLLILTKTFQCLIHQMWLQSGAVSLHGIIKKPGIRRPGRSIEEVVFSGTRIVDDLAVYGVYVVRTFLILTEVKLDLDKNMR